MAGFAASYLGANLTFLPMGFSPFFIHYFFGQWVETRWNPLKL